jgi:hypothetical protein
MFEGFVAPDAIVVEIWDRGKKKYDVEGSYVDNQILATFTSSQLQKMGAIVEFYIRFDFDDERESIYRFGGQIKPTLNPGDDGSLGYSVGADYYVVEVLGLDLVEGQAGIATNAAAIATGKATEATQGAQIATEKAVEVVTNSEIVATNTTITTEAATVAVVAKDTAVVKATEATQGAQLATTKAAEVVADKIKTGSDVTAVAAIKTEVEAIKLNSSGSYDPKGDWNAATNTPTLTANAATGSTWVPGVSGRPQRYSITVAGALPFAIRGYAQGATIPVGYLVQHSTGQWYYEPQDSEALAKIGQVTTQATTPTNLLTDRIDGIWGAAAANSATLSASTVSKHTNLIPVAIGDVLIFEGLVDTLLNTTIGKIFNASGTTQVTIANTDLIAIAGGHKYTVPLAPTTGGSSTIGLNLRNADLSIKIYKGYQVAGSKTLIADASTQFQYAKDSEAAKKDILMDSAFQADNIATLTTGTYSATAVDAGVSANSSYSHTQQISGVPGESFLIKNMNVGLALVNFVKFFGADNKMIGPTLPASILTNHAQGKVLTIPADRVGVTTFGFNAANVDNITLHRSFDKIKPAVVPPLSELNNDAGFVTSSQVSTNDQLFDDVAPPANVATWLTGYWGGNTTNMNSITASATYDHCSPLTVDVGFEFAISGLNLSLAQANLGKFFNASGIQVGSNITPADLVDITGGKKLTVPNLSGITYLGLNINHGDGNVLVQPGNEVILEPRKVLKTALIPVQPVPDATVANLKLIAYNRGASVEVAPAKKYGILVLGQSNAEGRIASTEQPSDFITAGRVIPGALFCNNDNGTFANYSLGSGDMFGFELFLYKQLLDYLKTKYSDPTYQTYAVKFAVGGTPISEYAEVDPVGYWQALTEKIPTGKRKLSLEAKTRIKKAIEMQGANFDIRAIVWHQGETDRLGTRAQAEYFENLAAVIAYIRGVLGNPKIPFIIGGINTSSSGYSATINAAMRELANDDDAYTYYAEVANGTSYLKTGDTLHFNALGGQDIANSIFNIIKDF